MPITWRNVNTPNSGTGLAVASSGLNQVGQSINRIFDDIRKREEESNQSIEQQNAALFRQSLRNAENPESMRNVLAENPSAFGNLTGALANEIGAEPARREQEEFARGQLELQRRQALAENLRTQFAPLQRVGNTEQMRNFIETNAEEIQASGLGNEFMAGIEEAESYGLGVNFVNDLASRNFDSDTIRAAVAANADLTPSGREAALKYADTRQAAVEQEMSDLGNGYVQRRQQDNLRIAQPILNSIDTKQAQLASELGVPMGMLSDPSSMVFSEKFGKSDMAATVQGWGELLDFSYNDYDGVVEDIYDVYTEKREELQSKNSNVSGAVIHGAILSALNKGAFKGGWWSVDGIDTDRLKALVDDELTNSAQLVSGFQRALQLNETRNEILNRVQNNTNEVQTKLAGAERKLRERNIAAASRNGTGIDIGSLYQSELSGLPPTIDYNELQDLYQTNLGEARVGTSTQHLSTGNNNTNLATSEEARELIEYLSRFN